MPSTNPYEPSSHPSRAEDDHRPSRGNRRVVSALLLGIGCCLIGPIFLTIFYWHLEIEFASWMLYLYGLAYLGPGLMFVGMGLLAGYFLSFVCPQLDRKTHRWLIRAVIVIGYSISITSFLSERLNFVVEIPFASPLPAFSVVCAAIAMVVTTMHLAFRRETESIGCGERLVAVITKFRHTSE